MFFNFHRAVMLGKFDNLCRLLWCNVLNVAQVRLVLLV